MAILGSQNNGGGFTRDFQSTSSRRMDTFATITYVAGQSVLSGGVWLAAAPAADETVVLGVYNISSGADGAPLIYSLPVTANSSSTAGSYVTVSGLSDSLPGLSGGETLALALAYSSGSDAWPGRRVAVSTSLGNTGSGLVDPWVQTSTSGSEAPDAYFEIGESGPQLSAPASAQSGAKISFSAPNFSGSITDATLSDGTSTLTLTNIDNVSGDDYTADVPPLPAEGNSAQYTTFGAVMMSVTDGTDTAEAATTLIAPEGGTVTIIEEGFDTSELSWLFGFEPDPPPIEPGDQGIETSPDLALDAFGGYVADTDGSYPITVIDKTDGVAQTYPLIVGPDSGEPEPEPEPEPGEPGQGAFTSRRMTRRAMTRRSVTSRSLTNR